MLWNEADLEGVLVDLPITSSLNIYSSQETVIKTHYFTEGEYQNSVVFSGVVQGNQLYLSEQIAPTYEAFNDKLSAHKVFASQLDIYIPENIFLQLKAQNCQVKIIGDFQKVAMEIREGEVQLEAAFINGKIKTDTADIFLRGIENTIFASTKKGRLKGNFDLKKNATLSITSREGNISNISRRK